jgi:hydrogenase nickel incorporation protein HypA/HybF
LLSIGRRRMHEASIAKAILDAVEDHCQTAGIDLAVSCVHVRIGALSAVVPDSLEFAFSVMKAETRCSDASLEWEEVPLVVACQECGASTNLDSPIFVCGYCGAHNVKIASGRELELTSFDVRE